MQKIFAEFIFLNLSKSIDQDVLPSAFKLANMVSAHKKNSKSLKDNYRPVSILSNISNAYEKFMFRQISKCFESFLWKYQLWIQKGVQYPVMSFIDIREMEICRW